MNPARIDFIKPAARTAQAGIVLLVAGAVLAGAAVMDDSRRSDELSAAQEHLKKAKTALTRALAARPASHGELLGVLLQNDDVRMRLASPWGSLLDALEQAQNDNIALLGVEPNAETGRLHMHGEARDMNAIVDYIKSLNGKAGISGLRLLSQQVKESDAQHPLEFTLEADWSKRDRHAKTRETTS